MPSFKQFWNLAVVCPPSLAEAVGAALEEGAVSVTLLVPPRCATARVEALYQDAPDIGMVQARMAMLALFHGVEAPTVTLGKTGNFDWLKKVASDFPPLPIARWTIYGAMHRDKIRNPRLALQIDATSAFGTGEHPTTRGCLLMLDELLKREGAARLKTMLDVGCGSGILAMAQAKACRGRAVALDCDPEAVRIAEGNVRANGLRDYVRTGRSQGYRDPLARRHAPYDLVMANIFARPLCLVAKDLKRHLRPGGHAILSGILNAQAHAVLAAHRSQGLYLVKRLRLGEWSVLALRRSRKA